MPLLATIKKRARKAPQQVKPKQRHPGRVYPGPKGKIAPKPRKTGKAAFRSGLALLGGATPKPRTMGKTAKKGRLESLLGAMPAKKGK